VIVTEDHQADSNSLIHVLIGKTISTKSGMVENNRNSTRIEYSNVAILLSLSIVFFFFFFYFSFIFQFYNMGCDGSP